MIYKVKNIKDEEFSFEGLVLAPQEISKPLTLEVYQRIMALYYNSHLMPIDDPEIPNMVSPEAIANVVASDVAEQTETVEQTPIEQPEEFACDKCDKKFPKQSGMRRHQAHAHKENIT